MEVAVGIKAVYCCNHMPFMVSNNTAMVCVQHNIAFADSGTPTALHVSRCTCCYCWTVLHGSQTLSFAK